MTEGGQPRYRTVRGYQLVNRKGQELTPAMEDYLEMAYKLCEQNGYARVSQLSRELSVRASSASKMILKLTELEYLAYDQCESVSLTPKGRAMGAYLLLRHDVIEGFLRAIGSRRPLEEAELIEHFLSPHTVERLQALLPRLEQAPTPDLLPPG